MLRDLIRKDRTISCLTEGINAEISVLWGFIFSTFLDLNSSNADPSTIKYAVILIVGGAFVTRLIVYYLNIPNLRFRSGA